MRTNVNGPEASEVELEVENQNGFFSFVAKAFGVIIDVVVDAVNYMVNTASSVTKAIVSGSVAFIAALGLDTEALAALVSNDLTNAHAFSIVDGGVSIIFIVAISIAMEYAVRSFTSKTVVNQ